MTEEKSPKGLGGWLIVPIIIILFSIIGMVSYIWTDIDMVILSGAWGDLTHPDSEYYYKDFYWLFPFRMTVTVILLIGYIYLAYLFFTKHYKFPKLFILVIFAHFTISLVTQIIISKQSEMISVNSEWLTDYAVAIVCIVIGVPYMLKSVRVKNTFINGRRAELEYKGIVS